MSAVRTARAFIEKAIKDHNVVVFSKTACPFSILAKRILSEVGVQEMQVYEIERREDGQEIQEALQNITGRGTVPNVFIKGTSIGGGSETAELYQSGRLKVMLEEQGIIK
ncbi:glutaredoxin-C8-like [Orbicella faveolata]|uniref:glutaredoxin-C8-like n=1 Tax=Orbicella faveolata TaxID=48498 RepID=UPI0009E3E9E6|nr:glutaredoxin-C8-like [Orbicella faveolata]